MNTRTRKNNQTKESQMYKIIITMMLSLLVCSVATADTGKIIAYGHELNIVGPLTENNFNGMNQDTLRLGDWPIQPLRCTNPDNYQSKALKASNRLELTQAAQRYARQIQEVDGYQAAVQALIETLLLRPDMVVSASSVDLGLSAKINSLWTDGYESNLYFTSPAEFAARSQLIDETRELSLSNSFEAGAQHMRSATSLVDSVKATNKGVYVYWKSGVPEPFVFDSNRSAPEESSFDQHGFRIDLIKDLLRQYNDQGDIISFGCASGFPYQTNDPASKADQVNTVLNKIANGQELDVADIYSLSLAADLIINDIRNAQGGQ